MTEIERKALALVCEVADGYEDVSVYHVHDSKTLRSALCRAIEQHEAFRREVSDAIVQYCGGPKYVPSEPLARFIIAKPDPLIEVVKSCDYGSLDGIEQEFVEDLRAALAARGLKIVEDK